MVKTRTHEFAIVLEGVSAIDERLENAILEAGCDDALLAQTGGAVFLDFDRAADSLESAVVSAVRDLTHCGPPIAVSHVEPDDLVSASEISRRLGCSREYVRLLILGKRGNGGFPAPRSGVTGTSPIWSWVTVLTWLEKTGMLDDSTLLTDAEAVRDINRSLQSGPRGTRVRKRA